MTENDKKWVGSWSTSPIKAGINFHGIRLNNNLFFSTARTVIRPTLAGNKIRIVLSNRYGSRPLTIAAASVGTLKEGCLMNTEKESVTPITFGGKSSVTIPIGEDVTSDAVDFTVYALKKIAVSLYVRAAVMQTKGLYGSDTWLAPGNCTKRASFLPLWHLILHSRTTTFYTNPFLTRLDVLADADACAIVVAGDSTVVNEIPYMLEKRLLDSGVTNVAVLQQALQGNRVLEDGRGVVGNLFGKSMLNRFDEDVLSCPGIKSIIFKNGFNDISHPRTKSLKGKVPMTSAQDIIDGYKKLVKAAHEKGIKIYIAAMSPSKGFERKLFIGKDLEWNEEIQSISDEVDRWILNNIEADGGYNIDFVRDENDPFRIRGDYTRDFAHFTRAGQQAFVDKLPDSMLE